MFFTLVGIVALFRVAIGVAQSVWRTFCTYVVPRFVDNKPYLRSMGKWAVITGATTGVGKEYAFKLAQCGINIVLISRSEDKLKSVSAEIEETYNVDTKIIAANFLNADNIYDDIRNKLSSFDIGILVNNVGIRSPGVSLFLDVDDRDKVIEDILKVNCLSVPMMTGIVLPNMLKKKKGIIINVSSFVGRFPVKWFSIYGASKAFVCYFSYCLQQEYSLDGIEVQVLTPWVLSTQMTDYIPTSYILPSAKTYVNSAFRTIGYSSDTCGYWPHDVMSVLFESEILQTAAKLVSWLRPGPASRHK